MKKSVLNIVTYLGIFLSLFIIGSVSLVLSFRTKLFSGIDVLFYRGVLLILFWGLLISGVLLLLRRIHFKEVFLFRDAVMLFVVFCSVNLVFFTHVPVTADRSITVFMLGYMSDHEEESFTEDEIEEIFIARYVKDYGAFKKRFHEQIETGTIIEVSPGEYHITEAGKQLMLIYDRVASLYQLDDKLIHPDKNDNR